MHFDDVVVVPQPLVSPNLAPLTDPKAVQAVWDYFITPLKAQFEAVNKTLADSGEPPEELPLEVRLLGAILRSYMAGLDPKGSGWEELRKAAAVAKVEFEAEQTGRDGVDVAAKIKSLVSDLNAIGDPYVEGVRDAYEIASGETLAEPDDTRTDADRIS